MEQRDTNIQNYFGNKPNRALKLVLFFFNFPITVGHLYINSTDAYVFIF